jgi:hypothetical protein
MEHKILLEERSKGLRSGLKMSQTVADSVLKNEQGVALILALVMLSLLGMLGAFALSTSSTELHVSTNFRTAQTALYCAEAGDEFLKTQADLLMIKIAPTTGNCLKNKDYNTVPGLNVAGCEICYNVEFHKGDASEGSGSEAGTQHSFPFVNVIGYYVPYANSKYYTEMAVQSMTERNM